MSNRAAALFLALLSGSPALAGTPMDDRDAAFDVLARKAGVERRFSNCRWIRGVRDDALLARWRRDNSAVSDAARAVIDAQGGLTERRGKMAEGLAEMATGDQATTREGCQAFLDEARAGAHDLSALVPMPVLRGVLTYAPPAGEPLTWTVEQRRGPDGVLRRTAKTWVGEGDLGACEDATAATAHIFLRRRFGADLQPVADPDPDLWQAECVRSPVDPVTGAVRSPS